MLALQTKSTKSLQELKKISNGGAVTNVETAEAQTLTDEQLCASVDKSSGYIRFTLKKRRNSFDGADNGRQQLDDDSKEATLRSTNNNWKQPLESRAPVDDSSAKRTKFNNDCSEGSERRDADSDIGGRNEKSDKCATSQSVKVTKTTEVSAEREAQISAPSQQALQDGAKFEERKEVVREHQEAQVEVGADKIRRQVPESPRALCTTRKASADSIQMDTSQASTSSSSDVSIKSIVSLKSQQRQLEPQSALACKAPPNELAPESQKEREAPVQSDDSEHGLDEQRIEHEGNQPPANGDPAKCLATSATNIERRDPLPSGQAVVNVPVVKSIVSETARKLEAAVAAANNKTNSMRRPVAAARRTLKQARDQNAAPQPQLRTNCHEESQLVATGHKEQVVANVGGGSDEKENWTIATAKALSAPSAKKPSICWPPKAATPSGGQAGEQRAEANDLSRNEDRRQLSKAPVPTMGRVTANRLSFQKMIEETNKNNNNNSNSTLPNRAKPPPPVKPAGLVLAASTRLKATQT